MRLELRLRLHVLSRPHSAPNVRTTRTGRAACELGGWTPAITGMLLVGRQCALPVGAPQDVPAWCGAAWSLATSYERREVVFMVQGGRASAGRPSAGGP